MTNPNALIIFAREPKPGKVKTRLSTDLDPEFVASLYGCFVRDVMTLALGNDAWTPYLFFADPDPNPPFIMQFQEQCTVIQQQGEDLGARMHHAVTHCVELGHEKVIIIGTDCLEIGIADLQQAYRELDNVPYCVGPSQDGGYYLIGTNVLRPEPFTGIDWGTDTVLRNTLEKCRQIEHNVTLLSEKEDIDTIQSLSRFRDRAVHNPVAPITTKFISENKHRLP